MKIKTTDLIGPALDWAVAQCEMMREDYRDRGLLVHRIGYGQPMPPYSTDWAQGGPIIEQGCICTYASGACSVTPKNPDYWVAEILGADEMITQYGPTPLIAATRCVVAANLGDEVDVPDELV